MTDSFEYKLMTDSFKKCEARYSQFQITWVKLIYQ